MRSIPLIALLALGCSSSASPGNVDGSTDGSVDSSSTDGSPSSECPEGRIALFDGPGCDGTNKRCVPDLGPDACAADVPFCGCDGKTKSGLCSDTQFFPYRSKDPCPSADAASE
jgi:hypothetical protein